MNNLPSRFNSFKRIYSSSLAIFDHSMP